MTLATGLLAGLLLLHPAAPGDTVPTSAARADAYLDEGAREMVTRARARVEEENRRIAGYRVIARQRMTAGLRALGRERLMYRSEVAARVEWERDREPRVTALGAREVAPVAEREPKAPGMGDLAPVLRGFVFTPERGWVLGAPGGEGGAGSFVHPLQPGSEEHYLFRTGEPTAIRLPDGRRLDLLELQVVPRRAGTRLLRGSMWLDAATHAPVRGVFRVRVPDAIGVSGTRVSFGVEVEFTALVIEYALWHGRWWLPRLMALEGTGTVGGLSAPLRMELAYDEFEIFEEPAPAEGRPDSPSPWADPARLGAYEAVADSSRQCVRGERYDEDRCRRFTLWLPRDRSVLVDDAHLPESAFAEGPALVTRSELRDAVQALARAELASGFLQEPRFRVRPLDLSLLRYNRVEGATVGSTAIAELGALRLQGSAWWALAAGEPGGQVTLTRSRFAARDRIALYRRMAAFTPQERPFELGNTLNALVLGGDVGDYLRVTGAELGSASTALAARDWSWRLYAEQQRPVESETEWNLARAVGWHRHFRPNPAADSALQWGAEGSLRVHRGLDPMAPRATLGVSLRAETGDFTFVRPGATAAFGAPLPAGLLGAVEAGAGTSFGGVPLQSRWAVGGPSTLRGAGADGRLHGEAHWYGRGEVGTRGPRVRLIGFGEAGWAGPRDETTLDPARVAAGAGVSVLDGLIRADLARTLRGSERWQLQLYLGMGL